MDKGITPLSYASFSGLKIGPANPLSQLTPEQQQQHQEQQQQQLQQHHGKGSGLQGPAVPPMGTKDGGLGIRWPKGMWDNMDGNIIKMI